MWKQRLESELDKWTRSRKRSLESQAESKCESRGNETNQDGFTTPITRHIGAEPDDDEREWKYPDRVICCKRDECGEQALRGC